MDIPCICLVHSLTRVCRYDVHHDYFDPRLYAKDKSTLELTQDGRRNRMATVLWYA
jgi:hypothetical protein